MANRLRGLGVLLACAVIAGGCAAGQAFHQGEDATKTGRPRSGRGRYRKAAQADPDNPRYKITLERAMQAASRYHLDRAREFERQDQLEAALGEYKLAAENDPSNRGVATKIASMEKTLRDRAEAERPKPAGQQLREQARAASAAPILNPASRQPRDWTFNNVGFKDILNFIGDASGINVSYDREVVDRPTTLQLNGATVEQAINQVMAMNQLSYKVVNERSIFVFADTPAKHTQYDEQVIRTFYIQHADVTELSQLLSSIIRLPNIAVQPAISFSKSRQLDDHPGQHDDHGDPRAGHRAERQAARRDRVRHRDPRGRSRAREDLRLESVGVRAWDRVLAGGVAERLDYPNGNWHQRGNGERHGHDARRRARRRRRAA